MTDAMRNTVATSIERTAVAKGWNLLAVNVRTNHVHVVVSTDGPPESALTTFKAWATRSLRQEGLVESDRNLWSRHGSTRHLFTSESIESAVFYVNQMQ